MPLPIALGVSDFGRIRRRGAVYVDKTSAITSIVTSDVAVCLLTRPRRFGKSTFLSSLETFLQLPSVAGEDTGPLFEGLDVWRSEAAREHHQRYPVLALNFKDMVAMSWPAALELLRGQLDEALRRLAPALDTPAVPPALRQRLDALVTPGFDPTQLPLALRLFCEALHLATGQPAVLLIDEYDTPLHVAWQRGYLEEALSFFRGALGLVLKDNRHLHKAVITGILRVARESLFSGVNHLEVWSMLRPGFSDTFGFTQAEVEGLAAAAGLQDRMAEIEAWYNGYLIGGVRLYNPWSVLNYLKNPTEGPAPYWVNSGGTALVEALLDRHGTALWPDVERLLLGGSLTTRLEEGLVFADLETRPDALWSLLLAAGYLKPVAGEVVHGERFAELTVPNQEVLLSWRQIAARNLRDALRGSKVVDQLTRAMLTGEERVFGELLRRLAVGALSFHDTGGDWPERVWQAFVLGVLVHLDPDYEVRSNLEVGYGRADVVVRPRQPGRPGVLIELKRIEPEQDPEAALAGALQQIADRDYEAGLRGVASPVLHLAIVFAGKKPYVRFGGPAAS